MANTGAAKQKVLLTGGSGFVASHVLDALLENGFSVVVTARSLEKGKAIIERLDPSERPNVSFEVVEDIAKDAAFDHVFKSHHDFDYVVHTASPCSLKVEDPVRDFLDPAIKGTTGILKSVHENAPSVKRVVMTSSSAAILNPIKHEKVYSEDNWAPYTWEDALQPAFAYAGSKKLAERAAWDFVASARPAFDLATINNTYTFGPVPRQLGSLDGVNTSNQRIRDLVLGHMRARLESTAPVFTWVDVRDVARAHVRAMVVPAAGGRRFYLVAGHFSNKMLADCIRRSHPELEARLPPADAENDLPPDVYRFDNSRSREVLGLVYLDLDTSVRDTVDSLLDLQARQ